MYAQRQATTVLGCEAIKAQLRQGSPVVVGDNASLPDLGAYVVSIHSRFPLSETAL